MPRFHFHLQEDNRLIEDEIGLEVSDEASARGQAMQAACAMARDLFVNSEAQRLVVDLPSKGLPATAAQWRPPPQCSRRDPVASWALARPLLRWVYSAEQLCR